MRNDDSSTIATEAESTSAWSLVPGKGNQQKALTLLLRNLHDQVGLQATKTTSHVCLTMAARRLEQEGKRAPVDIMIAMDVSGSMTGNKLALCKVTLRQLIRLLSSEDRFGLITYDSRAQLDFLPSKMTPENKALALQKLEGLRTRGATNISAAIGLAFQEIRSIQNPNAVSTIFLLTDGHANQGISDDLGLVEFTKNCVGNVNGEEEMASADQDDQKRPPRFSFFGRKSSQKKDDSTIPMEIDTNLASEQKMAPISMHTFGYGTDHNADLLADLAKAGGGGYYFVENDSNVAGAFGDALGGIMSVVAQNVTATIKVHPMAEAMGAKILKVRYDQAMRRENGSYTVNVGDFYAEEARDVLVEIELPTRAADESIPQLAVSLSYSDTIQKSLVQGDEQIISILRSPGAEISNEDPYVAAQILRVATTEEMKRAQEMANRGNLQGANYAMAQMRCTLQSAPASVQTYPMVQQLHDDLSFVTEGMQSPSMYRAVGSKRAAYKTQTHSRQRCSEVTYKDQARSAYVTSSKAQFMANMKKGDP